MSGPARGSLALNADGSFTYTPGRFFAGEDSFVYRARDPATASLEHPMARWLRANGG